MTTERLVKAIDPKPMRVNCLTSNFLTRARVPISLPTDRDVCAACFETCWRIESKDIRLVLIPNTLELTTLWISPALAAEGLAIETEFAPIPFDDAGALDQEALFPNPSARVEGRPAVIEAEIRDRRRTERVGPPAIVVARACRPAIRCGEESTGRVLLREDKRATIEVWEGCHDRPNETGTISHSARTSFSPSVRPKFPETSVVAEGRGFSPRLFDSARLSMQIRSQLVIREAYAMRFVPEVTARLENKPGRLAKISSALAHEKVDVLALSVMDSAAERSVLRLVTDNLETTRKVLTSLGAEHEVSEVLAVEIDSRPGALARVLERLAEEHINIEYAYSAGVSSPGKALAIFHTNNPKRRIRS